VYDRQKRAKRNSIQPLLVHTVSNGGAADHCIVDDVDLCPSLQISYSACTDGVHQYLGSIERKISIIVVRYCLPSCHCALYALEIKKDWI
jgi:hypothetical protein